MCSVEKRVSFEGMGTSVNKVEVVGRVAVRARVREDRRRTRGWK